MPGRVINIQIGDRLFTVPRRNVVGVVVGREGEGSGSICGEWQGGC